MRKIIFLVIVCLMVTTRGIGEEARASIVPYFHMQTLEEMFDAPRRAHNMREMMKSIIKLTAEPVEVSENTRYLLALTIHCEAGIEDFIGKVAVGTVIMNRVEAKHMGIKTITGQIYAPYQFSCVGSKNWKTESPSEDAFRAADLVLKGYRTFGKNILFYANKKIATNRGFVNRLKVKHELGRHSFGTL